MQSYQDIDSFADASALSTLGRMRELPVACMASLLSSHRERLQLY